MFDGVDRIILTGGSSSGLMRIQEKLSLNYLFV